MNVDSSTSLQVPWGQGLCLGFFTIHSFIQLIFSECLLWVGLCFKNQNVAWNTVVIDVAVAYKKAERSNMEA